MPNKYYSAMSKITADASFKEKLVLDLENNTVANDEKYRKKNKGKVGIFMKIKKVIIAIISALVVLTGSGAVYAYLGGTINGVPVLEWMGIKFSNNYVEYVEPVENQFIENENGKITLESTVCDDGFTVLQFRVNLNEEKLNSYKTEEDIESGWEVPFVYLSFNDPIVSDGDYNYTNLGGANYNLIVDNEDVWVRGKSAQSIEEISEQEYLVYQMWFLDDSILNEKEDFVITLKDVAIALGEDCIGFDGNFNIEVSKEKALQNTTTFEPKKDSTLKYKGLEKSIEKVTVTPLQNIVKIKNVYEDISLDDLTYVLSEKYVGQIEYLAYDQNNNLISSYAMETSGKITYEDGTTEELVAGDFEFSKDDFKHATYEVVEMIAIEQNEDINKIKLELCENSDYYNTVRNIMEYNIDLNSKNITAKSKDELIYDKKNKVVTEMYKDYYKKMYNIEYEDYNYDDNDYTDLTDDLNYGFIMNNSDENTTGYEEITSSDISSIDVEIEKEVADGIEYTNPVNISDKIVIENIVNVVANSVIYLDFENDFGAGDYFEGTPIVTLNLNNGKKLYITACDNFTVDQDGYGVHLMYMYELNEDYDKTDETIYIAPSEMQAYIELLYVDNK